MGKIKIAIVGVGNCASALVQGLHYYSNRPSNNGIMHHDFGGYKIKDIQVVAAFDIDKRKVGKDVSQAIFSDPNCTEVFAEKLPRTGVKVMRGPVLDGVTHTTRDKKEGFIVDSKQKACDVVAELKKSGAEVIINFLPVGSQEATDFYADAAIQSKCAFVNCIPVFVASNTKWEERFRKARLPIIGDDIKSLLGATIVHRMLAKLFSDRGIKVEKSYQLNVGGNTDFLNMKDPLRLTSKKISKTEAVRSQMKEKISDANLHVGPSDYVPWLKDTKICLLTMRGKGFGDTDIVLDLKLEVVDSPNSAGVVIDAIRAAKLAMDRGLSGNIDPASAYFMKHPPRQYDDHTARENVERFLKG